MEKNEKEILQKKNLKKRSIKTAKEGIDRGLKFTWREFQSQASFYKKLSFGLVFVNSLLVFTVMFKIDNTTFFILDSQEKPVELTKISKLPLTENRVISFVDEATTQIFSINYRHINQQLDLIKKYFEPAMYQKFMLELTDSNYLTLIKKNKAIMTVVPTPTVFKIKVIGPDTIEVIRSFAREDISKNLIETKETAYRIVIVRIAPSDMNPWGFVVKSLKEVNINDYKSKF
jgi:hypothetical protein